MTLSTVAGCRYLWHFSIASVLLFGCIEKRLAAQCVAANGDSSFAQDTGTPQFPGDRQFFFRIARVVGPGVANEYVSESDPDPTRRGTLVNWQALQQNGVVAKSAYLQFSGEIALGAQFWGYMTLNGNLNGEAAAAAVKFRYSINGVPLPGIYVASATISNPNVAVTSLRFVRCVAVDTKFLRFGKKILDGGACPVLRANEKTCPGVNEVSVRILSTWWGSASVLAASAGSPSGVFSLPFLAIAVQPSAIRDSIDVRPGVGTLSFKALHPVVLIHGSSSSEWFWTNSREPSVKCNVANPPCDPHWGFEQAFIDQHVPYFRKINMKNATAELHVEELKGIIAQILSDYGTKYVHLVGHSKGGIDSRFWMAFARWNAGFPVLSLTTVSTPHHGSVLADYTQNVTLLNTLVSNSKVRSSAFLAQYLSEGRNASHPSLTTDFGRKMERVNQVQLPKEIKVNLERRKLRYYSISADANINNSIDPSGRPTIELPTEVVGANNLADRPPYLPDLGLLSWESLTEEGYRLVFTVREVRTEVRPIVLPGGVVVPTSVLLEINDGFFQNDFLVSLQSARVTGLFAEIASIKANHTSVANFGTATTTLNAIRAADPVQ